MDVSPETHAIEDLLVHSGWLSTLALRLLRDVAEAEEFVQETWLKALARPPRKEVPIRPWLARVLRNTVHEERRAGARRSDRERGTARDEVLPSTSEMVGNVESQTLLAQLVLELEEPYKSAVMLRYYEGLSAVQIARRMDIPAGTVRWRTSEGLKRLTEELDRRHGGERLAWCTAFAPLAGIDRAAVASTATTITLTLGILTMKPLLAIGAALLGVLIYTLTSDSLTTLSAPQAAEALERDDLAVDLVTPEQEVGATEAAAEERESLLSAVPAEVLAVERPRLIIVGRTLDQGGRAVAGARVAITLRDEEQRATDSEGRFEFEMDPPPYYGGASMRITARDFSRTKVRLEIERGGLSIDLGDIMLAPGGSVSGWVRDEAGVGQEGAEVFAMPPARPGSFSPFAKEWEYSSLSFARTDAQGRFVLSGVPTGFVDVCAQKEAMLSGRVPGVAVAPRSETRDVSLVLGEIPADSVISGIVLDEEDAPVPHAPLTIRRHSERGVWVNSMTADGQGRFRLEKEVDGPVTIQAAGRRTRRGEGTEHHRSGAAEVEPGTRDLILRLRAPQWIEIAARDEHGDAVPVDSVYIVSRTRSEGGSRTSSSAKLQREEDSVSVSIVCPAVRFGLVIDKVGYETVEIPSMEPGDVGERIEVVLRPLPVLRGVVRTGAAPVEGAVVQLHSVVPENQEFTYAGFPWLWLGVDGHGTMTDAEGRFALPLDFEEIKEGLDFVLHASGERLAPALSRTFRLDGLNHPREIEIEMMPGGSIGGRLLLPDGTSPAGMYVGASNGDGTLQAQRVAADGAFRFDHLMPGNWLVERMESEHGHARGSGGGTSFVVPREPIPWSCRVVEGKRTVFDLDFRTPTTALLTGRLMIDGRGPGPWRVSLMPRVLRSRFFSERIPDSTSLDPDGNFEFTAAPPGEYALAIRDGDWGRTTVVLNVHLVSGDQSVQVEFTSAPLSGRRGAPVEGEELFHIHETPQGARVMTPLHPDESGAFEARVPVGLGVVYAGRNLRQAGATLLRELDVPPRGLQAGPLD